MVTKGLNPQNIGPGEEQHKAFTQKLGLKRSKYVQYDYRDATGKLFSCVKKTLEECRAAKDAWMVHNTAMRNAKSSVTS